MALLIYVFLLMSLVAAAFSRQVQWWVLRCESSQCLGVYERWRAWACLRSEYGGERCKVNNGSFDTMLCHEEWVSQEKERSYQEAGGVPGSIGKWKPWVLDEAAGFIVIYLPSKWRNCEFLIYLVLFYFFVLFCKAYLFPPLKECTRHTDDVLGNAWSLDVRICLQGGFLVGMP